MPKMVMEQGKVSRARPKALSSRMFLEPDRIHWKSVLADIGAMVDYVS